MFINFIYCILRVSSIFQKTIEYIPKARRIVHQGGQSSGKTVNILIAIAKVAAEQERVITITSMSFPHLKAGAMRDFERYVMPEFSGAIRQYRRSDHVVLWKSGSITEFKSYKDEFDARGAKRDILFVNEANSFDFETWRQLDTRSEVSIIDYNPTIRFWAHEKVNFEPGTIRFISDHRNNVFIPKSKHDEIESFAVFARNEDGTIKYKDGVPIVLKGDLELFKVYSRGLTGNVQGVIFPNWTMIEDIDWTNPFFAIDFGYTNDPTAIVKIERVGESIFIEEVAYQTGSMTPRNIKSILEAHGYDDNSIIYCEHDPDMIKQLKLLGLRALGARKGAGSVKAGIEKLKEYKVYYKGRNIKKETGLYIWKVDDEGKPMNTPIDLHNHAIDAIRYGVYSHFYRSKNAA